jgi:hypothetical protein
MHSALPSAAAFQVGLPDWPVQNVRSQVEELQLDPENGIFLASEGREIPTPITSPFYEDRLLTRRVLEGEDENPNYLPLELIRLSHHHDLFLLPFSILNEEQLFSIWFLNQNLGYLDQQLVGPEDVSILYRLCDATPRIPAWLTTFAAPSQLAHQNSILALQEQCRQSTAWRIAHGSEFANYDLAPQPSIFFGKLLDKLMPVNLMAALLAQLRQEPQTLPHCNIPELLAMWQFSCRQTDLQEGLSDYSDALSREHRYVLLKELHLLQNGSDLVFNPFLGRHQVGEQATFLPMKNASDTPAWVNKAVLFRHGDVDLAEFRGPGVSMMVTGYQIGASRVSARRDSASAWLPTDYGKFAADAAPYLRQASQRGPNDDPCIHVVNLSLATNLGHSLWNDISGYYLIDQIIKTFPGHSLKICIHSFQEADRGQSYNEFFHPFVTNSLPGLDIRTTSGFEAIGELTRPMVLNSMVIPDRIAEAIRQQYLPGPKEDRQIRILVNLRAHNKSLLNTGECLEHWLALPATEALKDRLEFCLEFHEVAKPMCDEVANVLQRHGIAHQRLIDCNLDRLCQEIAGSDVVIAPVGSALVLPTWIWNLECVAHGDPVHMTQLYFWPAVAPSFPDQPLRIHAIAQEAIEADSPEIYANYRVRPEVFSSHLQAALARTLSVEQSREKLALPTEEKPELTPWQSLLRSAKSKAFPWASRFRHRLRRDRAGAG